MKWIPITSVRWIFEDTLVCRLCTYDCVSTLFTLNITNAYCHHSIISSICGEEEPPAVCTGPAAGANGPLLVSTMLLDLLL